MARDILLLLGCAFIT